MCARGLWRERLYYEGWRALLLALLLASGVAPEAQVIVHEQQQLSASDPARFDFFGIKFGLNGDLAVIGAWHKDGPADRERELGASYVFERDSVSGLFMFRQKLTAPTRDLARRFGWKQAIVPAGDDHPATILVSSSVEDAPPPYPLPREQHQENGAVHVFEQSESGAWEPVSRLAIEPRVLRRTFGHELRADKRGEPRAIVGSKGGTSLAAHIIARDPESGNWSLTARLVPRDSLPLGLPLQRYAWSAALSGRIAAVADEAALVDIPDNIRHGSVHVFEQDPVTGDWAETAILRPPPEDAGRSLTFGRGLDIVETDEGSFIFVSALGVSPAGAVYVYRRDGATRSWVLDSRILPDLPISGEGFGGALSAVEAEAGGILVASSARNAEINGLYAAGAVYVFHRAVGEPKWSEIAKLGRKDPVFLAYDGRSDVAISAEGTVLMSAQSDSSTVATGRVARAGSAYRFEIEDLVPVAREPQPAASGAALRVTPNPASGAARIALSLETPEAATLRLFDARGREVYATVSSARGSHVWEVSTEGWAAGVYIVRAEVGGAIVTAQLTVAH